MKQYVGTKVVQAELATRGECYKGPLMLSNTQAKEPGYKVIYPDGYESWSPKEVFEKAYRANNNLTFGLALEALKMGKKIARNGWNGKGQYVTFIPAGNAMFQGYDMQDCFGLKNSQSKMQPGWVPSIGDCLAEDWHIIE